MRLLLIAAMTFLLMACEAKTYATSADKAWTQVGKLGNSPEIALSLRDTGTLTTFEARPDKRTAQWRLWKNNEELGRVIAHIVPVGKTKTRIKVEFVEIAQPLSSPELGELRKLVAQAIPPVMNEAIVARLESRKFDVSVLSGATKLLESYSVGAALHGAYEEAIAEMKTDTPEQRAAQERDRVQSIAAAKESEDWVKSKQTFARPAH